MAKAMFRHVLVPAISCCALVGGGLAGTPLARAGQVSAGRQAAGDRALTADDAASASALAAATEQPVEILSDRTGYEQTFANPDGGFTLDESPAPVRVQQPDGSWVPVDTTLIQRADGTITPQAITAGLALSGGGPGPLYTFRRALIRCR